MIAGFISIAIVAGVTVIGSKVSSFFAALAPYV